MENYVSELADYFGVAVNNSMPSEVIARMFTLASINFLEIPPDIVEKMRRIGAIVPGDNGNSGCYGILYNDGANECSVCIESSTCKNSFFNLGLNKIRLSENYTRNIRREPTISAGVVSVAQHEHLHKTLSLLEDSYDKWTIPRRGVAFGLVGNSRTEKLPLVLFDTVKKRFKCVADFDITMPGVDSSGYIVSDSCEDILGIVDDLASKALGI